MLNLILPLIIISGQLSPARSLAANIDLPLLGDTSSSMISQQQEYELGRVWLSMFRSRVNTLDDPELQTYFEDLLHQLSQNSELTDHRLELIVVNNPTMNAFAVPGGVVGVHTGLFRFAETEDQLASVLAHELAHLSQRHFARSLQTQKVNSVGSIAGLLAGIILAATVGGDAGMAAMTATQAATLQNSLRYSRQNEQEADRIGLDTLYKSGRNPAATSEMFERMLAATRYTGQRPPEFLLTHPLTEKRVADARNRINNYPLRYYPDTPRFHLMRARAMIYLDNNYQRSIKRFSSEMKGFSLSANAARYGLALAQSLAGEHDEAWDTLQPLLKGEPNNLTFRIAAADLHFNKGDYDAALKELQKLEPLYSNNYALLRTRAEIYLKAARYQDSERVLKTLSEQRPNDPKVWFELAEVNGLSGNISGVHLARAEYFMLIGVYDQARQQLEYARKLLASDYQRTAIIDQRLIDISDMEDKLEKL
jgi:predicted Zn-dependent protease